MKNEINNGLQPPEAKSKWEIEREAFEEKALNWVKYCFRDDPTEIFDLYEHDKEVAIKFFKWMVKYTADWGSEKIFVSDKKYPMRMTIEEIWEIFCKETKQ